MVMMTLVFKISGAVKELEVLCDGLPVRVRGVADGYVGSMRLSPGRHTYRIDAVGYPGASWTARVSSSVVVDHYRGLFAGSGRDSTGDRLF